ncbi:MAG TPA: DUF362 domain-containing protein [Bacteroidales bacterium]|jgi:uncharacterized protein (DUF362 family)|nr:DUF362 domain-containing protein [Bacteroidales bacterium]
MRKEKVSRRKFIGTAVSAFIGTSAFGINIIEGCTQSKNRRKDIVSIVRVNEDNVASAVKEAIDLLGGISQITYGQNRIMLKPNLVAPDRNYTTNPEVVFAVAKLMKDVGKDVMIGEGSAAADSFNVINGEQFITKKEEILDRMQQYVFDSLGYSTIAETLNIPLINLHTGEIVELPLKDGLVAKSIKIHKKLTEVDLVCSIPIMKTHVLATVTLAMKNLIGLYPGKEYYAMRSWLHDRAIEKGSSGVAYEIIDINRSVKTGLSIIDATIAMEGNGPTAGTIVDMGLIIAGTSPLATDMVGTSIMGFEINDIPLLRLAHNLKMEPFKLSDIEIRGLSIAEVKRPFIKPDIVTWTDFGYKEI